MGKGNIASCKEASRLISESLERRLSFKERLQLGVHLALCHACNSTQKQFAILKKIFNHYKKLAGQIPPTPDTEEALSPDARTRIKSSLI